MPGVESSILVPKSTQDVFSFLNASESHRRFIPRMTKLDQTSPGTFGQVGTRLSGVLNYFGMRIPVQYEIVEVAPEKRLAMKGKMGPFLFKDGYILIEKEDGTEIQFWLEMAPTGWAKLFSPFMGLIGRVHAWETLRNLKRELMKREIASHGDASPSSPRSSSQ